MAKTFKFKKKEQHLRTKTNKRMMMTLTNEEWDMLNFVREPNHSIQECIRQILRAYLGIERK